MIPQRIPIRFEPFGLTAWVESGTTVHEAALVAGVPLSAPCGGRGVCGSCAIRVIEGTLGAPDEVESARLSAQRPDVRLGCRAKVVQAVAVRPVVVLPTEQQERARFDADARVVVAVDLGTTSVSAVAVDVDTGTQGTLVTLPNAQAAAGADVLSRVAAALDGRGEELRRAAVHSVREAVEEASSGVSGVPSAVVVAGNTAMSALLAGADVSTLARHPFSAPAIPQSLEIELGAGCLDMRILPPIASFVGGDTVACLIHTGMCEAQETALLVDLGTNAEIALVSEGRLWVASAAAGPAFEGAGIESGRMAAPGSIVGAEWRAASGLELTTLAGVSPTGVSGSGLISLVNLLRSLGHLDPDGLLVPVGPLEDAFFRGEDDVLRVSLTADGGVTLSQLDVRQLQLAKAAVAAGVTQVMACAGIRACTLGHLYVAGAFGSALAEDDVVGLGIVPESARGVIHSVGNASLYGALAAALDRDAADVTVEITRNAEHVDLVMQEGFQSALMAALTLEPYDV